MKYIVANWKMNMDKELIQHWFERFNTKNLSGVSNKTVLIAPSLLYLDLVTKLITQTNVKVCAQNLDHQTKGAHTGSVGAFQIKDYTKYTLLGHSELNERRNLVDQKIESVLLFGITPIVCFVNTEGFIKSGNPRVFYAWEDPQNISINGIYRPKDLNEVERQVKKLKRTLGNNSVLLYGGSVNREAISELAKIKELDGYLVGNASLDPEHFYDIIVRA